MLRLGPPLDLVDDPLEDIGQVFELGPARLRPRILINLVQQAAVLAKRPGETAQVGKGFLAQEVAEDGLRSARTAALHDSQPNLLNVAFEAAAQILDMPGLTRLPDGQLEGGGQAVPALPELLLPG